MGAEEPAFGEFGRGQIGDDDADHGPIWTVESGTKPNSLDPDPKNGMTRANAAAATVVQSRRELGRLRHAGPHVRRTSTTPSSVSSDTTNHVVWKVASPAWNNRRSAAKVRRSKTELTSPKTIM